MARVRVVHPQRQQLVDLLEGEAQRLGPLDEADPVDGRRVVLPVSRPRTRRRLQQAPALEAADPYLTGSGFANAVERYVLPR